MKEIHYDELEKDKKGRIRECHFCISKHKNYICTALEKFYNFEDNTDMCGKCPFFKTDEEFLKGWGNINTEYRVREPVSKQFGELFVGRKRCESTEP